MVNETKITSVRLSNELQKDLLLLKIRYDYESLNDLLEEMVKAFKKSKRSTHNLEKRGE